MQCFEVAVSHVKQYWVSPSLELLLSALNGVNIVRSLPADEANAVLVPVEDGLCVSLTELAPLYRKTTLIAIAM